MNENLDIRLLTNENIVNIDFEKSIYDLQQQINGMISQADKLDYFVSVASGMMCGMLDILWVGDFSLESGRAIADEKVNEFVKKVAKVSGCKDNDLKKSVAFLEKKFPISADGNTADFGGGLQHHLRDFAHHPTIIGLAFSLLTQFTEKSYGTDVNGNFIVVPVPEKSRIFVGKDVPEKIVKGTIVWFFHLISDIAGSSSTVGLSGGTGIPGPILSLAKELSTLPFIKKLKVNDESLSVFLSKLFNGTLFAKHDENGKIIKETVVKFDFRGELGVAVELGKQAVPVIANECIVRIFYFIRRIMLEIKSEDIKTINEFSKLDWNKVKPFNNPTLKRMLTISTGVFTAIDIAEAVGTQKYWVSVNYVGVGRFTVAVGTEMIGFLKLRKVKLIKQMYEEIERNTYNQTDDKIYKRIGEGMDFKKFGLTLEQTEILYNLEWHKTINDIKKTSLIIKNDKIVALKEEWIKEWKKYISIGFSSFVGVEGAELHWYSKEELIEKVKENEPEKPWLRLVLLEAMLFEPYYPLSMDKDKKGNNVPSKKYKALNNPMVGYKQSEGDKYLESYFNESFYTQGYIKRLRKCYDKVIRELKEVLKAVITSISITAVVTIAAILTAGMFAPAIAVALVGSNFAGLSGAALTSACLAYLGGGAIAAGGLGMAGGTMAIVGGSAILGFGVGAGVGGTVGAIGVMGEKQTILQSAKLMVSVREIFLNDEHDIQYSNTVYEQYVQNIANIEKGLVDLKLQENVANKEDKKQLKLQIKNAEESVKAMKIAMKSMKKFKSSFEVAQSAVK